MHTIVPSHQQVVCKAMTDFALTPYDGRVHPFTLGVKPLDPAAWIEPDGACAEHLREKWRLFEAGPAAVFRAEPHTRTAQLETLVLLLDHLKSHFPDLYDHRDGHVTIKPLGRTVAIEDYEHAPLALAGLLVQEDLCLIEPGPAGHRLTAALLCFPSSWSLSEKIGKPLLAVHEPVPGYADDLSDRVERLFSRLPHGQILWRMNWSLDHGEELHRPVPDKPTGWLRCVNELLDVVFIRVERQTIRRLPQTGFILFTIKVHLDPLSALSTHPDRARLAGGLLAQLSAFTPQQTAYKGLTLIRDDLIRLLGRLAGSG